MLVFCQRTCNIAEALMSKYLSKSVGTQSKSRQIEDDCEMNETFCILSIGGHRQKCPAVLERLARAQQAPRASVRPSACSPSAVQSRLSPF